MRLKSFSGPAILLVLSVTALQSTALAQAATNTTNTTKTSVSLAAQAESKAAGNPLASIAWLTGGTWVAEVKDQQGVVQTRIENRIRHSENGHLIKFITTFITHNKPEVHYEGIYAYDPAKKQIGFWYSGNDGDLTSGYVTVMGNTFTHDFDIAHMNGKVDRLRSVIVRDGDNAYNWSVSSQKDGQWAELFHLRYVRENSGEQK